MNQNKGASITMEKGFNYERMVQEALRNVLRETLVRTSKEGLTGSHYFYLTFQTNRSDVIMPEDLREKHPEEITIVLQHQFWDLKVDKDKFEVTLSFNDRLEKLSVPFGAMVNFLDPSVKFGLQFIPMDPSIEKKGHSKETKDKHAGSSADPVVAKVVALDEFRKK